MSYFQFHSAGIEASCKHSKEAIGRAERGSIHTAMSDFAIKVPLKVKHFLPFSLRVIMKWGIHLYQKRCHIVGKKNATVPW